MSRKFLVGWFSLFVVWMVGSFIVHGLLLGNDYAKLVPTLFRSPEDSQRFFPLMLFAHLLLAGAFVWIYERGRETKPWLGQGLRFGLAIALLTVVPTYIIYYVVQPTPAALALKQIIFDSILLIVLGIVAAFVMKDPKAA